MQKPITMTPMAHERRELVVLPILGAKRRTHSDKRMVIKAKRKRCRPEGFWFWWNYKSETSRIHGRRSNDRHRDTKPARESLSWEGPVLSSHVFLFVNLV
jgi:hypothetical protein